VVLCFHQNQLDLLRCSECSPNELLDEESPLHCSDETTNDVANCGFTLGGGMSVDNPEKPLHRTRFVDFTARFVLRDLPEVII
jgi:hypothetical protein